MLHHNQGLTLIEVLVGIAILALAMLGVFSIYTHCMVELKRAQNRTLASDCAQQMLEQILSMPSNVFAYHGLSTTSTPPADLLVRDDLLRWAATLERVLPQSIGTIMVTDDPETPYAARVTVAISYLNHGRPASMTVVMKVPQQRP